MEEVKSRLKVVETRLDDLRIRLDEIKEEIQKRTDKNDVKVLIDESLDMKKFVQDNEVIVITHETLKGKNYMTKAEVQSAIKEHNLKLVKWIVGTGISIVTLTVTILKYLL